MTFKGRSDGLVVESDRKKYTTFTLSFSRHFSPKRQGNCIYTSGFYFFRRQCVAPIALMDKPPLLYTPVEGCGDKNRVHFSLLLGPPSLGFNTVAFVN